MGGVPNKKGGLNGRDLSVGLRRGWGKDNQEAVKERARVAYLEVTERSGKLRRGRST